MSGRHGSDRVAKLLLLGAITPLMLKTEANPQGTPIEAFDAIRASVSGDRSQFYQDLSKPFYGANRPGNQVLAGDAGQLLAVEHAGRPQGRL
jgi:non-heme chloroperoxidase